MVWGHCTLQSVLRRVQALRVQAFVNSGEENPGVSGLLQGTPHHEGLSRKLRISYSFRNLLVREDLLQNCQVTTVTKSSNIYETTLRGRKWPGKLGLATSSWLVIPFNSH